MRHVFFGVCLIAVMASGISSATPPGKPINHEAEIAGFTREIENTPTDQRAYFFRGVHHIGVAHCLEGVRSCVRVKMTDANDAYQKAIADFTRSIELGAGVWTASVYDGRKILMGDSYHYRGTIHATLKAYEAIKTADRYADRASSFHALGNIYRDLGDEQKAIETYSAAIERCRGFSSSAIYIERGKLHAKRGEREKALSDAKQACEWTPPHNDCKLLDRLRGKK
ncbi:MAG: tetratricopeptide repeat protein [Zoogloeaceae bacterium]|nr:tetratricopeptide repeat protein [Zoogloeaceae bacterium]